MNNDTIVVRGAREHNLRNVDLELPRDQLIVFTGLSGSGKSSLAFDTIYAEGQRRYVESLSAYARQFLGQMDKPDVDFIEGLSPAISIDQKSASRNPRSTVGTITEIYDYLRLLYARIGVPHCPNCGQRDHPPDAAADRRPRAPAARRHALPGARAGRARPQGRVRGPARRAGQPGLHAGPGRRRGGRPRRRKLRARRATRTTPSRWSSTGWCAAPASSAGSPTRSRPRCSSPKASPRSRSSREDDDPSRPRDARCSRSTSRARTAACRSTSSRRATSRSTRRTARASAATASARASRSTPSCVVARRRPLDRRRRDRAVVGVPRRVLRAGARGGRRRVRLLDRHAVEEAEEAATRRSCSTAPASTQVTVSLQEPLRAPALVHHAVTKV